jgi:hypothetical protein
MTPDQISAVVSYRIDVMGHLPYGRMGLSSLLNPLLESSSLDPLESSVASRPVQKPTQPPTHWVPWAPFLGVKWPGHEAYHSSPSSAEVKKAWSYTSTPPKYLHGMVLSYAQDVSSSWN